MALRDETVRLRRWQGGQHPTVSAITRLMQKDGLRPYMWQNQANARFAVSSHGYDKVLFVVEGGIEVTFPDSNQRTTLRVGDRVDIPAGVRHGIIVGGSGVKCMEASIRRERASRK